jgi:hypothetical protein
MGVKMIDIYGPGLPLVSLRLISHIAMPFTSSIQLNHHWLQCISST